ncbi:MAG: hypothetical protein AAFV19_06570 [Pseudomonadota bacterium]
MLVKRKELKRVPKKSKFAFLVELKPDTWSLGMIWETYEHTFFNSFFIDENSNIPDESWKDVLFSSSISPDFLRKNRVFKVDLPDWVDEDLIEPPKFGLRPRNVPYEEGQIRGWDGMWHQSGVDLVPLSPPYTTLDGADAFTRAEKEALTCENDLDLLVGLPLTIGLGRYTAMERLECCRILGCDFDPYKAKLYPNCEALDLGIARQTSWFNRGNMPLLGLIRDDETSKMYPA